jgi:hypothetical protein
MFMIVLFEYILHFSYQTLQIRILSYRNHIGVVRSGCHLHGLLYFWQF